MEAINFTTSHHHHFFQQHRRDCYKTVYALFLHQFTNNVVNNADISTMLKGIVQPLHDGFQLIVCQTPVLGYVTYIPTGQHHSKNAFTVRHVCIQHFADNFFNSTVHVLVSFTGAASPPRPLISPVPRKSHCIRGEIRCGSTTAHRASGKGVSVPHPRCRGTATTGG